MFFNKVYLGRYFMNKKMIIINVNYFKNEIMYFYINYVMNIFFFKIVVNVLYILYVFVLEIFLYLYLKYFK